MHRMHILPSRRLGILSVVAGSTMVLYHYTTSHVIGEIYHTFIRSTTILLVQCTPRTSSYQVLQLNGTFIPHLFHYKPMQT